MIEPQSAQLGASAWALNVTWALPMLLPPRPGMLLRVTRGLPLPLGGVATAPAEAKPEPALALVPESAAVGAEGAAGAIAEAALLPLSSEAGDVAGDST